MMSGATLGVTTGDLLIIFSILLLFVEILKATRFGVKSIIDHMLSFVVFVAALVEFIMVQQAATSTFLLLLVICAVDVIGGFSISIRAASRDYTVDGASSGGALIAPTFRVRTMTRDFHLPGRSPVYATGGMVATSHPLASLAAVEILRAGGTAADAAVAAMAVACVGEPHMTGIGGDCFCLVARPGQPIWGYNGSGRAGAAMRAEALIEQGLKEIAIDSVHAVTVPGAIEAWDTILKTHGRFGLDRVLAARDRRRRSRASRCSRASRSTGRVTEAKLRKHAATRRASPAGGQRAEGRRCREASRRWRRRCARSPRAARAPSTKARSPTTSSRRCRRWAAF